MKPHAWQLAASLAARAHAHQVRKDGTTPYVAHPFRVAMTVREVFECRDEIALASALLHDTIEDTTVDYDDLLAIFGKEVADCVAALTKNKTLREDIRETTYDAGLAAAAWQARLVKLADTYDNLSDVPTTPERDRDDRLKRMVSRCERAVKLARVDEASHAETRRAIAAVEGLVKSVSGEKA